MSDERTSLEVQIAVLYVGSSLLAPLRNAEHEINRRQRIVLRVVTHNFGAAFADHDWRRIENDLRSAQIIFVIHVMDGENASRLIPLLDQLRDERTVIVINCMAALMKRSKLGRLDFARLPGSSRSRSARRSNDEGLKTLEFKEAQSLFAAIRSWTGRQTRNDGASKSRQRAQYLKFAERLPGILKFVPGAGALRDVKNYLTLFCYFLQPTPANINSMLLFAVKHYSSDRRLKTIEVPPPESLPSIAIYHPDAERLFESFAEYQSWYHTMRSESSLKPALTIGLLLMRPQIISKARRHYDELIRSIEAEGLSVIPAISTLMDNREACERFFLEPGKAARTPKQELEEQSSHARVSQIVSLTGFSFVGGPAMNDSQAAEDFLGKLKVLYRSLVSLDTQTIESWRESPAGLNPVQTGMQIAIPEIDGATEPFVFGGIAEEGVEPAALEDRCLRIAKRLKRWNHLQNARRGDLRIALVLYCFPPNKGNIGTAADLDVFASLFELLRSLSSDGYDVHLPATVDELRRLLLDGNSKEYETTANVGYQMTIDEYRGVCPFVSEIEKEWGAAPGKLNVSGSDLLIQGIHLGNVFVGVQPTFGYEGDPMRLLMARSGAPHHGFAAFYTYLEKVFKADAVVHVGTHGAMEFMPGKQVGLSSDCWPDRLIGELPNVYIYSVNNPSEGTIAKRRSYAELISYLTPPIESAGLYKGLALLKEQIKSFQQSTDDYERDELYRLIEETSRELNLNEAGPA